MKRQISILLIGLTLTGCGSHTIDKGYDYAPAGAAVNDFAMDNYASTESVAVTGGDYSRTEINGDNVDYSYTFRANGKTNKTKDDMLSDYEYIQQVAIDNGGLIEDVYNDYFYYDINEEDHYFSYYDKHYKAVGKISFTVEIPNDKIDIITDELEKLCADNKFTVTNYSQTIRNYELYDTVENPEEDNYYGETITQHELDRRLAYADLSVNLEYRIPREATTVFYLTIKNILSSIWDMFEDLIQVVVSLIILIFIAFLAIVVCYKCFKRMVYKHKKKHPELYQPKGVYIISEQKIEKG